MFKTVFVVRIFRNHLVEGRKELKAQASQCAVYLQHQLVEMKYCIERRLII